jgi:hypothetical protein
MIKKFDTVQMVRNIRDDIYRETKNMADEELMVYFRKGSQSLRKKLKVKSRISTQY